MLAGLLWVRLPLYVVLLCLGLLHLGLAQRDLYQQTVGLRGPLPAPAAIPRLGISADLAALPPAARPAALADLRAAGVGWVRIRLDWQTLEPAPGEFAWAAADDQVGAVTNAGMLPVLLLDGSPAWARAPQDRATPSGHLAPPEDPRAFAAFVAAVAARYGNQVRHYQVWDEPNIAPHWGARHIEPVAYAQLLKHASVALRAADADAVILLAALAPTADRGHLAQDEIYFLDRLYAAGAAPFFDAVAAQPFGFAYAPDDPVVDRARLNFQRVRLLRQAMLDAGDSDKPIWIMRFGWNRSPGSPWGTVSAADQAAFTRAALDHAAQQWPWVATLGWADAAFAQPADAPAAGFALTPDLVTALRAAPSFPIPHADTPPFTAGWLPLAAWSALLAAVTLRGVALARRLPWQSWRAQLRPGPGRWLLAGAWAGLLLVYHLATWPPLLLLCLLGLVAGCLLRPRWGLALALALLPFHIYHKEIAWVTTPWTLPPAQAMLLALLPALLVYRRARPWDGWDTLAAAWVVISLAGMLGAWYGPAYRRGQVDLLITPLLLYGALRAWATTPRHTRAFTAALAAGGVLAAGFGVADWLQGGGTLADGWRRLSAPTFSPNHIALYLSRTLPLVIALALMARAANSTGRGHASRLGWSLAAGLAAVALFLTASRGALFLGLPAALLMLWWQRPDRRPLPRRIQVAALLALLVIALLIIANSWGARLGNLDSIRARLDGWQVALALWRDVPWVGVGPDGYWWHAPAYLPPVGQAEPNLRHPHNLWLEYATTGGLLGLLWLAAALGWARHRLNQRRRVFAWGQVGLLAGFAAALAHAQVDAFQALPDLAAWNWAALALLVAPWDMPSHDRAKHKTGRPVARTAR